MCHHSLNTHDVVCCIFWRRTLNNFNKLSVIVVTCKKQNKQIDHMNNTMSKRQGVFTLFFLRKNWKLTIFGRLYTCNIYIVTTRASLYMLQILSNKISDMKEFHIWHRHSTIQVKHSYIAKSVCVLFHWKLNFSLKIFVNFRKYLWV